MFNHFLALWIERQELEQHWAEPPESNQGSSSMERQIDLVRSKVCPKAKIKPNSADGKSLPTAPIDLEIEDDEEEWLDHLTPPMDSKENENSRRLDQIEGVLSELVGQLRLLSQQQTGNFNQ